MMVHKNGLEVFGSRHFIDHLVVAVYDITDLRWGGIRGIDRAVRDLAVATMPLPPPSFLRMDTPPKTQRGLNKPKCIQCGNVARSGVVARKLKIHAMYMMSTQYETSDPKPPPGSGSSCLYDLLFSDTPTWERPSDSESAWFVRKEWRSFGARARLERMLEESGNRVCADCGSPDPKWVQVSHAFDLEYVERFIAYISVSQDDVTLYVVEPRSSIVGSVAGSNQLSFSQNPQPFSNPNPNQLSAPNSGFRIDQLDDDEPTEKIVSTSQYSKFGLGQYPDFDIGQYTDFDDVSEEETDHACNDIDIGQYPNFDDETAVAEECNVDDNEEEVTTIPEEELIKKAVDCYTKVIRIKKDDCFDTKEDLKIALYTKCVEDGYQLKVNKSSKDRFETRVYRGHEIMTDMNARFKISISYSQAWRAKCYALELLRGSPEASFAQLPAYCHNLKLKNPGSVTHIKTDRDGRFELLFIAIGATIRSFITCMRPVIIVDGAHLKGRYLGVNLLAVAMDANNGILPIAYGANSIDNAVRRCFPDAFHGLCGVHLYRNLKSRSAGIKKHKWTYWKAVKAYREVDFNKHINCLRRVLPQCAQTLEDVGFERWSRVHQLGARYGFMTSNSAESINALSRHSRKLPITMLMEFFEPLFNSGTTRKETMQITKRVVKSTSWRVEPCSNTLFQVLDNNLNGLVDLNAKTCSCMKWQTSGYPCGHVIKVALHLNQDDSSAYAMDCYTTEVYRQTYAEIVYPIPHPSEWDIPDDLQTVLPPAMDRRLPGRPKSHDRIPSKGEEKKRSTCSRCKESGHTRLTCGSPVPSKSSFPLPKYGSSSKSKAHMVSSKRQSSLKSQSRLASPFETVNLGDF
ncbi:hypothetical protein F3Y22_tig00111131pilonHSYRG00240 [Hibiscus syriacus]|uniref:SWIM-type domain-containing protein n=1 Tax=Hibiscus syriacus TaxID=106335 RepID=A0A6A2YZS7_HIBSY|nr:hypothetical protein F3Y22_tig00111131pilonHSYRG00240 [Hibiscus syriacus]